MLVLLLTPDRETADIQLIIQSLFDILAGDGDLSESLLLKGLREGLLEASNVLTCCASLRLPEAVDLVE
jgi:hypothetical protein